MKIVRLIGILISTFVLLLPATAHPQEKTDSKEQAAAVPRGQFRTRLFELKYRTPSLMTNILQTLGSGAAGSSVTANNELHTISVRDYPENIEAIQAAIERLDKPDTELARSAPDLIVELSLIAASHNGGDETNEAPPAIAKVVEQLRNTMKFKSYRYITTFVNRGSNNGRIDADGVTDPFFQIATSKGVKTFYKYSLEGLRSFTATDGTQTVQVRQFRFGASLPISTGNADQVQYRDIGIVTGLTVKDGEQVVVGTSNVGTTDQALIVVISIRQAK